MKPFVKVLNTNNCSSLKVADVIVLIIKALTNLKKEHKHLTSHFIQTVRLFMSAINNMSGNTKYTILLHKKYRVDEQFALSQSIIDCAVHMFLRHSETYP